MMSLTKQIKKGVLTMNLTYRTEGDFQLPNLDVPEAPKVGKYGMLRRSYLRNHKQAIYTGMLLSGKLNPHLEEVDQRSNEMMEQLTTQMAQTEGVTEQMKATDEMKWVAMMNNIRQRAEELVLTELVYS
jgi:hypothetical protein